MAFRNLFTKEIKSVFPLYGIFAVAVVLVHLLVLYRSDYLDIEDIMALSLLLPFSLAAAIAIGTGYYQLHTEWKTNSIYLLLSLPVRGWKVLSAKLAAVLSLLILTTLWIGASFTIILLRVKWDEIRADGDFTDILPTLLNVTLNGSLMCGLAILFLLVVVQFAFLCGRLVTRFRWLIEFSAFFGLLWLVFQTSPLLSSLLQWTPDLFFGGENTDAFYLNSGPFIVLLLMCMGLIALNGYIFEKEVEV
jgi:hypothetical protein